MSAVLDTPIMGTFLDTGLWVLFSISTVVGTVLDIPGMSTNLDTYHHRYCSGYFHCGYCSGYFHCGYYSGYLPSHRYPVLEVFDLLR